MKKRSLSLLLTTILLCVGGLALLTLTSCENFMQGQI